MSNHTSYPTTKFPETSGGWYESTFLYDPEEVHEWLDRCIADFPIDDTKTHTPGRRHWEFYKWREKWFSQFQSSPTTARENE